MNRSVDVFFYGSYINLDVLREVDLIPQSIENAMLRGYEILVRPLANIVPAERGIVFGILATATHAELARLYQHAAEILGGIYLPHAVIVETNGGLRPALCYISNRSKQSAADPEYVERIVAPARDYGFPDWYIDHLKSFK